MMTSCRHLVVIGITYFVLPCGTSSSSVVVECCTVPQVNRVQDTARACFFVFFFLFFLSCFYRSTTETWVAHHQFIILSLIQGAWQNNFSGPGTIILKAVFLCINSSRNPLLIHGFWPVNAQLLIAYGTAFYAITPVVTVVVSFVHGKQLWSCRDRQLTSAASNLLSLNIFIQNFSNMQHILYTIHSKWDWNESKMFIEFLSLSVNQH